MSQDMKPIPGCFDSKDQSAERLTEMFVGIGQGVALNWVSTRPSGRYFASCTVLPPAAW